MRFLGFLFVSFGVSVVLTGSAYAQTSDSVQINIKAVIAPAISIVINKDQQITQIVSNTTEDIAPAVYIDFIKFDNQKTLTPSVQNDYLEIMKDQTLKPGILYSNQTPKKPIAHQAVNIAFMFKQTPIFQ